MQIRYGAVSAEFSRWNWPSEEIFQNWKVEFLALDETQYFDIYLLGGFLEKINSKKPFTPDIDIILTGCDDLEKIERLVVQGTLLGLKKYQVFFDVLWFEYLPIYADDPSVRHVKIYIASNQWIVNGRGRKTYPDASPTISSLWEMKQKFPTYKQLRLLEQGYHYCRPLLLSAKSK